MFARVWKQATSGFATANKRIRRFLLNRALKQFLLRELDSEDSFELNLSDGLVTVKDLILNPETLNASVESLPIVISDGFVGEATFTVPWRKLDEDSVTVILKDVRLAAKCSARVVSPKKTHEVNVEEKDEDDVLDHVASAASDTLQQLVERVFAKIKADVYNLVVRLEFTANHRTYMVVVRVAHLSFYDDTESSLTQSSTVAMKCVSVLGLEIDLCGLDQPTVRTPPPSVPNLPFPSLTASALRGPTAVLTEEALRRAEMETLFSGPPPEVEQTEPSVSDSPLTLLRSSASSIPTAFEIREKLSSIQLDHRHRNVQVLRTDLAVPTVLRVTLYAGRAGIVKAQFDATVASVQVSMQPWQLEGVGVLMNAIAHPPLSSMQQSTRPLDWSGAAASLLMSVAQDDIVERGQWQDMAQSLTAPLVQPRAVTVSSQSKPQQAHPDLISGPPMTKISSSVEVEISVQTKSLSVALMYTDMPSYESVENVDHLQLGIASVTANAVTGTKNAFSCHVAVFEMNIEERTPTLHLPPMTLVRWHQRNDVPSLRCVIGPDVLSDMVSVDTTLTEAAVSCLAVNFTLSPIVVELGTSSLTRVVTCLSCAITSLFPDDGGQVILDRSDKPISVPQSKAFSLTVTTPEVTLTIHLPPCMPGAPPACLPPADWLHRVGPDSLFVVLTDLSLGYSSVPSTASSEVPLTSSSILLNATSASISLVTATSKSQIISARGDEREKIGISIATRPEVEAASNAPSVLPPEPDVFSEHQTIFNRGGGSFHSAQVPPEKEDDVPYVRVLASGGTGASVPFAAADDDVGVKAVEQATIQSAVATVRIHLPIANATLKKEDFDTLMEVMDSLLLALDMIYDVAMAATPLSYMEDTDHNTESFHSAASSLGSIEFSPRNPLPQIQSSISYVMQSIAAPTSTAAVFITCGSGDLSLIESSSFAATATNAHTFTIHYTDLRIFDAVGYMGQGKTYAFISARDLSVSDQGPSYPATPILFRAPFRQVDASTPPLLRLAIRMSRNPNVNDNIGREITVDARVDSLMLHHIVGPSWLFKLIDYVSDPILKPGRDLPDAIHIRPPRDDFVSLSIRVSDAAINYTPLKFEPRAILALGSMQVTTNVMPLAPDRAVVITARDAKFFLIGDRNMITDEPTCKHSSVKEHLEDVGFVEVARDDLIKADIRIGKESVKRNEPDVEVMVSNNYLDVSVCRDSFESFLSILNHWWLGKDLWVPVPADSNNPPSKRDSAPSTASDVMPPVQEDAHSHTSTQSGPLRAEAKTSTPTSILDMLDKTAFAPRSQEPPPASDGMSEMIMFEYFVPNNPEPNETYDLRVSESDADNAEDLPEGYAQWNEAPQLVWDYLSVKQSSKVVQDVRYPRPEVAVQLANINACLKLFDGHDWVEPSRSNSPGPLTTNTPPGSMPATYPPPTTTTSTPLPPPGSNMMPRRSSAPSFAQSVASSDMLSARVLPHTTDLTDFTMGNYFGTTATPSVFSEPRYEYAPGTVPLPAEQQQDAGVPLSGEYFGSVRRRGVRRTDRLLEVQVKKVVMEAYVYGPTDSTSFRMHLGIGRATIRDLVNMSTVNKMVCIRRSDVALRRATSDMFTMEMESVRPDPSRPENEELRLKIDIHPVRAFFHQYAIEFLVNFFSYKPPASKMAAGLPAESASYIQLAEILPLDLKIDYIPDRVDLRGLTQGKYQELVNFFPLRDVELSLETVQLTGIQGLENVIAAAVERYVDMVRSSQIQRFLVGIPGIRPIASIGSGIVDLVRVPMRQYQRDQRLFKGVSRGLQSFARAVATEGLDLTSEALVGIATVMDRGAAALDGHGSAPPMTVRLAQQPSSAGDGMRMAIDHMSHGFSNAATALVHNPRDEFSQGNVPGGMKAVLVGIPSAVLRSVGGMTGALGNLGLGVANTVNPLRKREESDRWREKPR